MSDERGAQPVPKDQAAKRFAIVGSGLIGLYMAHALRKRGHAVTLYSERSTHQWLNESKPTGVAGRFRGTLGLEDELELSHWPDIGQMVGGVHLTLSLNAKNRVLSVVAPVKGKAMAVDMRLQIPRWMDDLEARGGRVVVQQVDIAGLDTITAEHDLTFVAVGRGPLCSLFARDEARSLRQAPPRKLAVAFVRGPKKIPGVPFTPVKFNISPEEGETFWNPVLHKSGEAMWAPLIEAIPGKAWDRFSDCTDGHTVVARIKELIRERMPWEYEWFKDATLADEHGWLVGEVLPSVRGPVATLPSGRSVLALGDTAVSMDPCAGQGANNGARMVRSYAASIDERGDAPYDASWMKSAFEKFWVDSGKTTYFFSELLTQPLSKAGQDLITSAYGSDGLGDTPEDRLARAIAENFVDPNSLTPAFTDSAVSHAFIAEKAGGSARMHLFKKTLRIGGQQLRQKFGLAPRHP
jgi:Styrene monooxygenase A putative substrate binding domain/NAD(P)-binding Rossmann-like domain